MMIVGNDIHAKLRRLRDRTAALPEAPAPDPDGPARPATLRPVKLSESPGEIATGKAS